MQIIKIAPNYTPDWGREKGRKGFFSILETQTSKPQICDLRRKLTVFRFNSSSTSTKCDQVSFIKYNKFNLKISLCTVRRGGSLSQRAVRQQGSVIVRSEQEMDQWWLGLDTGFPPFCSQDREGCSGQWGAALVTLKWLSLVLPSAPTFPARPTLQGPHFSPNGVTWWEHCPNTWFFVGPWHPQTLTRTLSTLTIKQAIIGITMNSRALALPVTSSDSLSLVGR